MSFLIKTEQFEGPLDLLLSLIEKRKLFINDISIASVTEEYLGYINELRDINLEEKTGFLVIAATLILIKSRSLLPNLTLTVEESEQVTSLEDRLKRYQAAKRGSEWIIKRLGNRFIFLAPERKNDAPVFAPDEKVNLAVLRDAINKVLKELPAIEEVLPEVSVGKAISIEEMIGNLEERMQNAMSMKLSDFGGTRAPKTKEEKVYMIVSFLAMLELVRQGIFEVMQNDTDGEITISKQESLPEVSVATN